MNKFILLIVINFLGNIAIADGIPSYEKYENPEKTCSLKIKETISIRSYKVKVKNKKYDGKVVSVAKIGETKIIGYGGKNGYYRNTWETHYPTCRVEVYPVETSTILSANDKLVLLSDNGNLRTREIIYSFEKTPDRRLKINCGLGSNKYPMSSDKIAQSIANANLSLECTDKIKPMTDGVIDDGQRKHKEPLK